MNSAHDMGGMHGMGPVMPESDEPVFHAEWEGRVLACFFAMNAWQRWNIDRGRWFRELTPGPQYLNSTYYEIWLDALARLAADAGLVTEDELAAGHPAPDTEPRVPTFTKEKVAPALRRGGSARRDTGPGDARFAPGESVRARNIHPRTHTRLPRYVRGRKGVVDRVHGVFVFPDSNASLAGEDPQMIYSVRFTAAELWGEDAPNPEDKIFVDLWDSYLEPA